MTSRKNYGLEPTLDLSLLKRASAEKLKPSVAKKVWRVDDFVENTPENFVKSTKAFCIMFPGPVLPPGGIGVDPGLKLGLSYIEAEDVAFVLRMSLDRSNLSSAELLNAVQKVPNIFPKKLTKRVPVVVEGAAYNARFGQALLGQVRAALILGFVNDGREYVAEIQPLSIRKKVFGNGKTQPKNFWEHMMKPVGKDGLDALSMALCAGV